MTCSILVQAEFDNRELRKAVVDALDEDTRPDFEEELDDEFSFLFNAVDSLAYPEHVTVEGSTVKVYFEIGGLDPVDEFEIILGALGEMKGKSVYGYLDEDETILFYHLSHDKPVLIYPNNNGFKGVANRTIDEHLYQCETIDERLDYIIELYKNEKS